MADSQLQYFIQIITKGRKDNTYKFALARFLLDYSRELDKDHIKKLGEDEFVPYDKIATAFLRYYWHQECKYKIKQNHLSSKPPSVIRIIREVFGTKYISDFFDEMPEEKVLQAEKLIKSEVFGREESKKSMVVPRFQKMLEGTAAKQNKIFYDYDEKGIRLFPESISFFRQNYTLLYKLVILEWAKFLEKMNATPKLISKIESDKVRRHALTKYIGIFKEFKNCFYCKNILVKGATHVDHFIPWSYIFEDSAWNLVLSCDKCNLKKRDSLARGFLDKLILRNKESKNLELNKSLIELGMGDNWDKEIRRHYRNCQEYGFTTVQMP